MNVKTLVINGVIAALYVVVSLFIAPFGFTNIQFRISEMFNHLIVFDKRYFFGIVIGVFIVNLNSPLGWYDLVFGVAHSAISLGIIIFLSKFIKNKLTLLFLNTIVFTFNMFIIAFALNLALELPFWITWFTTAIGEFGVLLIGIPIFYALHKRLRFDKLR
ncbi:QueT transporter family protein [Oceanobacillus iheyensis]|uniref:Citrulline related protein n=1 Tax=Oceanobacillus iheyensis (strain DSM 14371 / CIP 107618 / JCM 11309 / KCTC 3954 / HTE831) TaxID=221109 RepID=Q8ET24_OCEIH|nr:QueT transporter family protein [Oceanobacillus iheyensis]BAC12396.1 citrulline related protein [Oceanobacillus iheyensis HTE831]